MSDAYTDLLLRIYPFEAAQGLYPVEAELDDGSRYTNGQLRLDSAALLALQLNPEAYGLALFNALFPAGGDIRRAYDKATGRAEAETGGRLRVRLWVDDDAVELHATPWERLYHWHTGKAVPLGASTLTPLSRYTSLEIREPLPIAETPIRILVAVSNPTNLPGGLAPANVDLEIENLRRALAGLRRENKVHVTVLPGRTGLAPEVRARLEAEQYTIVEGVTNLFNIAPHLSKAHVFHFIGHGAFRKGVGGQGSGASDPSPSPTPSPRPQPGTAALYLEKADGTWQAVRDDEITSMFVALGSLPHLIFLVACESAKREAEATSPFVGLGPKLVQAGVPAVVAMQEQVPVEFARTLSSEFYARLAEHGEVDRALNQARLQVFNAKQTEWAIPVLFMRIRKGRLFGADLDDEAPAPGAPPFKGLEYFNENDADKFFGRELLTAKLVGKLRESRFLPVIVGASGSGKSSVVRAGLLPALRRGEPLADGSLPPEGSRTWARYILTPGSQPLEALAAALTRDAESVTATTTLVEDLRLDHRALHFTARKIISSASANRLLLVVDQFEEIFTLCKDEGERRAFIDNLIYASAESTDGPTVVIIIFRADFYAHCAQYDNLRQAVSRRQEFVGPMSPEELRRAIEGPAKAGGWDFEPGLVDLILNDVGNEPGALPLMQHALLETWKRRRGHDLTLRGYHEAGGIRGAIAKTAEALYQNLPDEQKAIARRIFLKLVELGEGAQDTRRRAPLDELSPRPEDKPLVDVVLKKLVDNRLIVTTDKTAEVAHEALIREWPTYREWVNQGREGLKIHRDLNDAAREWEELARAPDVLYRGIKFLEALEWAETNPGELNPLEAEFLHASREATEAEARAKEEQQRRELQAARQIAKEQSRAARAAQQVAASEKKLAAEQARAVARQQLLTRIAVGVGGVALIAAVIAGVLWFRAEDSTREARNAEATAISERGRAEAQATIALSRQLAAQAAVQTGKNLDLALLLSIEAYNVQDNLEARDGLLRGLTVNPRLLGYRYGPTDIARIAFKPDGKTLVTLSGGSGTSLHLEVWELTDAAGLRQLSAPARKQDDLSYLMALSPDGNTLVASNEIWDVSDPANPIFLNSLNYSPTDSLLALAFNYDGTTLATSDSGALHFWNFADPQNVSLWSTTSVITETPNAMAFSPTGNVLATSSFLGALSLWDMTNPAAPELRSQSMVLDGSYNIFSLAFSPDGKTLATSQGIVGNSANVFDISYQLWNVADPSNVSASQPIPGRDDALDLMFISLPPYSDILISSGGSTTYLWSMTGATIDPKPSGELLTSGRSSLAFLEDGKTLVTASSKGIMLWDIANPYTSPSLGVPIPSQINLPVAFSFDASNAYLALGEDNQVYLWNVGDPARPSRLENAPLLHPVNVSDVAFSPQKPVLASVDVSHTVRLWDGDRTSLAYGQLLSEKISGNAPLAFSPAPRGALLALSGPQAGFQLWEVSNPAAPQLQGSAWAEAQGAFQFLAFVGPDGKTLAALHSEVLQLWDVSQPAAPSRLSTPLDAISGTVTSVAFSPIANLIATSSRDTSSSTPRAQIQLWDVTIPTRPRWSSTMDIGVFYIAPGLAFSANGQVLAIGGQHVSIQFWDVSSPTIPRPLDGRFAWNLDSERFDWGGGPLRFAPDGRTLLSINPDLDSNVVLWPVSPEDWIVRACRIAGRNLSLNEWLQYMGDLPYRATCAQWPEGN